MKLICALAMPFALIGVSDQSVGGPGRSAIVTGHVVDNAGRPVEDAIVRLVPFGADGSHPGTLAPAMTNEAGGFAFVSVPSAVYSIVASKPGFMDGVFGKRQPNGNALPLEVSSGGLHADLRVTVWRMAAIEGFVHDDRGDPVVGAPVVAFLRTVVAGRWSLVPGPMARTDDRGVFRFGSLLPTDYVVGVTPTTTAVPKELWQNYWQATGTSRNSLWRQLSAAVSVPFSNSAVPVLQSSGAGLLTNALTLSPAETDDGYVVYQSTYYPGASDPMQASVLKLEPGEEKSGLIIRLPLVKAVRLVGTVKGPQPYLQGNVVRLLPKTDSGSVVEVGGETATALTAADGTFELIGVPVGEYVLRVIRDPGSTPGASSGSLLWSSMTLSVMPSDQAPIVLPLREGLGVTGKALFSGKTAPSPVEVAAIRVLLEPANGRLLVRQRAGQISENGSFSAGPMPSGRYFLRVSTVPRGWFLEAATLGGKDISDVPVELADGDISDVTLSFVETPTRLLGTVRDSQGQLAEGATVFVFPLDSAKWVDYGWTPRSIRSIATPRTGQFTFLGLPAGEYLVAAMSFDARTWEDISELFKSLVPGAVRVNIQRGKPSTISVTVSEIRK